MSGLGLGIKGAAMLARLAGAGSAVKTIASKVPPKVWYALAIVAAIVIATIVHQHYAHKAIKAADEAGYARAVKVYDRALQIVHQRAIERRRQAEARSAAISTEVRNKHDQADRNSTALADALRVRGPGAAQCRFLDHPGRPAAAGGSVEAGGPADAALPRLPYPEWTKLLAMPDDAAVAFAEQHDLNRNEVLAWREWYRRQAESWAQLRKPGKR